MHYSVLSRRKGISKVEERIRKAALTDLVAQGQLVLKGRSAYAIPPQEDSQNSKLAA
jgi:hypothetical protein